MGTLGGPPGPFIPGHCPPPAFSIQSGVFHKKYICHANGHGPQGSQRKKARSDRNLTPILSLKSQLSAVMTAPAATTNSFLGLQMEAGFLPVPFPLPCHRSFSFLNPPSSASLPDHLLSSLRGAPEIHSPHLHPTSELLRHSEHPRGVSLLA